MKTLLLTSLVLSLGLSASTTASAAASGEAHASTPMETQALRFFSYASPNGGAPKQAVPAGLFDPALADAIFVAKHDESAGAPPLGLDGHAEIPVIPVRTEKSRISFAKSPFLAFHGDAPHDQSLLYPSVSLSFDFASQERS